MSATQTTYIKTPIKKTSLNTVEKYRVKQMVNETATGKIVFALVVKHRYGLVLTWAIAMTLLYLVPFLPDMLFGML